MADAPLVLVVDDEADVSRYLAAALSDAGYRTLVAGDAAEGLALLRSEHPDLVCLDLVLPGQTGVSLYREIRESPEFAAIPVVVVTGISPADAAEKLGFGGDLPLPAAYVEKPLDLERLLRAMRGLLPAGGAE